MKDNFNLTDDQTNLNYFTTLIDSIICQKAAGLILPKFIDEEFYK